MSGDGLPPLSLTLGQVEGDDGRHSTDQTPRRDHRRPHLQPAGLAAHPQAHPPTAGRHRPRRLAVGLCWTAAKVSTGILVRNAVDQGIIADDTGALRRWSLILGAVAVASATFTGLRRYIAFREARWVEADLATACSPTSSGSLRLPRPGPDRPAHEPGQHRPPAGPGVRGDDPAHHLHFAVSRSVGRHRPALTLLARLAASPQRSATRFSRAVPQRGEPRESAELAAVVEESVAGVRVVKGLGAERVQATRLKAEAQDVYDESMAAAATRAASCPAWSCCPTSGSSPCSATAATRCSTAASASARW